MREILPELRAAGVEDRPALRPGRPRTGLRLRMEQRQLLRAAVHQRTKLAQQQKLWAAAERYEDRFHIKFKWLTHFPAELLHELQRAGQGTAVPEGVVVASVQDKSIESHMQELQEIANEPSLTQAQRDRYYQNLLAIYRKLPESPEVMSKKRDTLCIGVQREGCLLGEAMGWLPKRGDHVLRPHAKRVPFEEGDGKRGLLVGLTQIGPVKRFVRCVIIDGAIASGATVMALIERLSPDIDEFHVYSVHATVEGLRAIVEYAHRLGVRVKITVGHATEGIDDHFYAVVKDHTDRVVIGDLGDTISDLEGHLRAGDAD